MGGVFVFGFPGIVMSAMKDELQGNFGKKTPKPFMSLLWVNLRGFV